MNHGTELAIKAALNGLILLVMLPIAGGVTWGVGILIAIAIVAIAYVLGDRWILPRFGNLTAVAADFILAWVILVAVGWTFPASFGLTGGGALLVAAVLGVGEWFFHQYLQGATARPGTGEPS